MTPESTSPDKITTSCLPLSDVLLSSSQACCHGDDSDAAQTGSQSPPVPEEDCVVPSGVKTNLGRGSSLSDLSEDGGIGKRTYTRRRTRTHARTRTRKYSQCVKNNDARYIFDCNYNVRNWLCCSLADVWWPRRTIAF